MHFGEHINGPEFDLGVPISTSTSQAANNTQKLPQTSICTNLNNKPFLTIVLRILVGNGGNGMIVNINYAPAPALSPGRQCSPSSYFHAPEKIAETTETGKKGKIQIKLVQLTPINP